MSLSCGTKAARQANFVQLQNVRFRQKSGTEHFAAKSRPHHRSTQHPSKKTHVQTAPIHPQQTTNMKDRGDHPRSCEIEWFVGFLSLGVIVLTVLFTYTTPISHRAESCARHSLKSARFSKSKIALRCSYDHHTRCPLAV